MTTSPSRLKEMLRDIVAALSERGVTHALAGGMAVAAHGIPRATKDIDFLIAHTDETVADQALRSLGFAPEVRGGGFVRYVRRPVAEIPELTEWADLLLARQAIGLELLQQAQANPILWEQGLRLPVVTVEGLILMKALAFVNDPSRFQDRADIISLLRLHRGELTMGWIENAATGLGVQVADLFQHLQQESEHDSSRNPPTLGL